MNFLSVRELRGQSARIWRELPDKQEMVITNNGRPIAVLTAVDDTNLEQSLSAWRQARALQAITDIQLASQQQGLDGLSPDEINAEITQTRRARRKQRA